MTFLTRFDDNQIDFGSGSAAVNADDIPETDSRIWLLTSTQLISGQKIFEDLQISGSIFLKENVNIQVQGEGDPGYIRYNNGSSYFKFESNVPDICTYTGHLATRRDLLVNVDGSEYEDCVIYFASSTYNHKLWWDGTDSLFKFSQPLFVSNSIESDGDFKCADIYLNNAHSNVNVYLNFGKPSTGNAYLYFNYIANLFVLSNGVTINGNTNIIGNLECDSFQIDQTPIAGTFTPDKYITISCNGTSYKIPVKAI